MLYLGKPAATDRLKLAAHQQYTRCRAMVISSHYQIGDVVDVKKHGRAVIIGGPHNEPGSAKHGRYHVRYQEDGTTFWVTPRRLRPRQLASKRVVVAYKTSEYRQAAIHNTSQWDVCLEIGCHAGVTTSQLAKRCQGIVGVDTTASVIDVAKTKYPGVRFAQLDGNDVHGCQQLVQSQGLPAITKVLIDISGQAPLSVLAPLLHTWITCVPDVHLIVKNRALHCLVTAYEAQPGATPAAGTSDQGLGTHRSTAATQAASGPNTHQQQDHVSHVTARDATGLSLGGSTAGSDDEEGGVSRQLAFHSKSVDEVAQLLLGGDADVQLQQQVLWLCEQCETFQDQAAPHRKQFVKQRVQQGGGGGVSGEVVVRAEEAALQQAANKAQEVVGKADRKLAKQQRRAARKAVAQSEPQPQESGPVQQV